LNQRVISVLSIACLVAVAAANLSAQEKKATPSAEEMAMMAAATPGPHHKKMMASVGTWQTSTKWMMPEAPPEPSAGTSTIESVMDGRFIQEVSKVPMMMGMPWEGRGLFGYDNTKQKHVGTWCDSWGTMIMYMEGTCDGTCKTITLTGSFMDPATKTTKTMKVVGKEITADQHVTELYDVAGGKDTKMGEITYTRKK
jgi:hypothetical protein